MIRFLPVSFTTILVKLADLDEALELFISFQNDPVEGIEETVPAGPYADDPLPPRKSEQTRLVTQLASRDLAAKIAPSDNLVEIPVHYDSEDLTDVAGLACMSVEEVIRRHTENEFTVAFCSFVLGFGYLVGKRSGIACATSAKSAHSHFLRFCGASRRFQRRLSVNRPGGWQIIGATPTKCGISTAIPVRFQPGYRLRFFAMDKAGGTVDIPISVPLRFRKEPLTKVRISRCSQHPCLLSFRILADSARQGRSFRPSAHWITVHAMLRTASSATRFNVP